MKSGLAPIAVAAFAVLSACSTSRPASTPQVASVLGEDKELFAVDWPTSMRADLEVNAKSSLAVVAVDALGAVRVLPSCTVDARYVATDVSPKDDLVRLTTRDEVKATLPFASPAVADNIGAHGSEDNVLDVAVVTRSVARAPTLPFSQADLRGDCAAATHVVTGLVRGAFAIAKRSKSDAAIAAEVFGVAAGVTRSRSDLVAKSDGSPDACRTSTTARDGSCGALLKVTLRAIRLDGANALTSRGSYWAQRSCDDDCNAICSQGDMDACAAAGASYMESGDEVKAERLLRMACDGNSGNGCTSLGMLYDPEHNGGKGFTDRSKAQALYARACDMGALTACALLALSLDYTDEGFRLADEANAERAGRACNAGGGPVHSGQAESCFTTAWWFHEKAVYLQASRSAGALGAFDRALAFEKRRCEIATPAFLELRPCNLESWRRARATLQR